MLTEEVGHKSLPPHPSPLTKIFYTYITMIKLGRVIPHLKKIQKMYNLSDKSLEFCWHQHFLLDITNFCCNGKYKNTEIFWYIFPNYFDFFWVFIGCFNWNNYNFDDAIKICYSMLLEIKIFWNKIYRVRISVTGYEVYSKNFIICLKLYCRYGYVIKVW